MWWVFFIIFFLISVVSSTLLFYSLRRITQYEEVVLNLKLIVEFATEKMKLVDAKGHYQSDDETSFFFEQLKQLQITLDGLFETDNSQQGDKENG